MRTFAVVALVAVLSSCTATHEYRRAAQDLSFQDGFFYCWTKIETSDSAKRQTCTPSDLAKQEEAACISNLSARERPHDRDIAAQRLKSCMLNKGWVLASPPFAIDVIESSRVAPCRTDYGVETCQFEQSEP